MTCQIIRQDLDFSNNSQSCLISLNDFIIFLLNSAIVVILKQKVSTYFCFKFFVYNFVSTIVTSFLPSTPTPIKMNYSLHYVQFGCYIQPTLVTLQSYNLMHVLFYTKQLVRCVTRQILLIYSKTSLERFKCLQTGNCCCRYIEILFYFILF